MTLKTIISSLSAAAILSLSSAQAQVTINGTHNHPSGENIYRIELGVVDWFTAQSTGDGDDKGELGWLEIELMTEETATPQRHVMRTLSPNLLNSSIGQQGRSGYVDIQLGENIQYTPGTPGLQTLWVHIPVSATEENWASVIVRGWDRDCSRQRRCRRGHLGTYTIQFQVPRLATPPSNRCGPANTFTINPDDVFSSDLVVNGFVETAETKGPFARARKDRNGPIMIPNELEICLARTWR